MAGKGVALGITRAMTEMAMKGGDRPSGMVRLRRLTRAGKWTLARTIPNPVAITALSEVERGAGELLEFVPEAGRGAPVVCGSPELLDAWNGGARAGRASTGNAPRPA